MKSLHELTFIIAVLNLPDAVTLYYSSSCCGKPNHKILLLLRNYNFATVTNRNYLMCSPCERVI